MAKVQRFDLYVYLYSKLPHEHVQIGNNVAVTSVIMLVRDYPDPEDVQRYELVPSR